MSQNADAPTRGHLTGPLDDPNGVRFVDSTGQNYSLWDAAHNATPLTRREFDDLAREIVGTADWCEPLFGPDQHRRRFDHGIRDWVPA